MTHNRHALQLFETQWNAHYSEHRWNDAATAKYGTESTTVQAMGLLVLDGTWDDVGAVTWKAGSQDIDGGDATEAIMQLPPSMPCRLVEKYQGGGFQVLCRCGNGVVFNSKKGLFKIGAKNADAQDRVTLLQAQDEGSAPAQNQRRQDDAGRAADQEPAIF